MTPTSASHRTLISRAAPAGSHVPLIPEHWFPAAYDDGEAVLRHLITTGLRDEHDVPMELSASFLMEDSVGDNIAHHVGQRWKMTTASTLPPPSDIWKLVEEISSPASSSGAKQRGARRDERRRGQSSHKL
uniref:Alpha/beta hydrolase fold-3 domain-containing protein n=1 Tax=Oryza nivara TaxID=4536 RepID=A0A0E0G8I1_ORYNI